MSEKLVYDLLTKINNPAEQLIAMPSIKAAMEFRRGQYELNIRQWASVLGMSPSHYSEFLHGKVRLPYQAACRAYVVGVSADILLQITNR